MDSLRLLVCPSYRVDESACSAMRYDGLRTARRDPARHSVLHRNKPRALLKAPPYCPIVPRVFKNVSVFPASGSAVIPPP